MEIIALTQRLMANNDYYEIREALDIRWSKLLQQIRYLPIVLPYEIDFRNYFNNISIDGILLTGGNSLYSCQTNELSTKRDSYEQELITYAISNNIPILGICRGMQMIAEYFGASLTKIDGHIGTAHVLTANQSSQYYKLLSAIQEVNAYHNYAINTISDDFIISAHSKDGIIKAIEHKNLPIFAQMWHSERQQPFVDSEIRLIKYFFRSYKK